MNIQTNKQTKQTEMYSSSCLLRRIGDLFAYLGRDWFFWGKKSCAVFEVWSEELTVGAYGLPICCFALLFDFVRCPPFTSFCSPFELWFFLKVPSRIELILLYEDIYNKEAPSVKQKLGCKAISSGKCII